MTVLRAFAYSLTGLLLGPVWFVALVAGWASGAGLAVTLLGLPVVWLTLAGAREMAAIEASLARALLGADAQAPPRLGGWRLVARATDLRIWRAQLYLLLRFAGGIADATVQLAIWGAALGLLLAPAWYWALPDPGIELGLLEVDHLWEAILVVPVGAAVALLGVGASLASRSVWRALAERLLARGAPDARVRLSGVVPSPSATVAVALAVELACVAVWIFTGRTSAWPAWTALGLAVPVGVQAAFAGRRHARSDRGRRLAVPAGLALLANAVCFGAWAISGGGAFWPAWVLLGTGLGLGLKAVRELGAESERRVLAPRVEQLARTRARVVDARDDELRRIERDLHDGAQARLVAMTMSLGMAEERLERDPDGARELVADAQQQARTAIKELRDLARGIAPPVLADRGLRAAVEALTTTTPLPVTVTGDAGPRPPASIERTGYFVAAEALANAGKHAGATAVRVDFARDARALTVTVSDDGRGGADPRGGGLSGLRGRVEGVDGRLEVVSRPGEGTTIRAVLPCASS